MKKSINLSRALKPQLFFNESTKNFVYLLSSSIAYKKMTSNLWEFNTNGDGNKDKMSLHKSPCVLSRKFRFAQIIH